MGKISYCSLEEAWGNTNIDKQSVDNNGYKNEFNNNISPIVKKNSNTIETFESNNVELSDKKTSDKLVLLSQNKHNENDENDENDINSTVSAVKISNTDIIEAYNNMQYSFEDKTIDLFVLFIMGIMIIYILDYFFNLGRKMK